MLERMNPFLHPAEDSIVSHGVCEFDIAGGKSYIAVGRRVESVRHAARLLFSSWSQFKGQMLGV